MTQGVALGERDTFADIGATIGAAFGVHLAAGKSMLGLIAIRRGWEDAV
jgi:phosphopentomutase